MYATTVSGLHRWPYGDRLACHHKDDGWVPMAFPFTCRLFYVVNTGRTRRVHQALQIGRSGGKSFGRNSTASSEYMTSSSQSSRTAL